MIGRSGRNIALFYSNLLNCANRGAYIIQQYGSYSYTKNKNPSILDNRLYPSLIKKQFFTTKYIDEYFDELIFLHMIK